MSTATETPAPLKEARFELVEVPEDFGSVPVRVDQDKVFTHAFAQGDFQDWYFTGSPFGGPVAHPLVLANDMLFLFYQRYDGNTAQGLHTHERLVFHAPIHVGQTVTITGGYVDKYERRGKGYVVLHAEARGEDGALLVTHHGREIMRTVAGNVVGRNSSGGRGDQRTVTGLVDPDIPTADHAGAGLRRGQPLPTLHRTFNQDQMNAFSWAGKGYTNVHTSIERARASSLDRTIVQAQQQTGILVELLTSFFGAAVYRGAELDLRFVNPAFVGDRLTAGGAVLGEQTTDDGHRLELEVWIDRDDGRRTALGWASALLDEVTAGPRPLLEVNPTGRAEQRRPTSGRTPHEQTVPRKA
jgi:acyl dehydratase